MSDSFVYLWSVLFNVLFAQKSFQIDVISARFDWLESDLASFDWLGAQSSNHRYENPPQFEIWLSDVSTWKYFSLIVKFVPEKVNADNLSDNYRKTGKKQLKFSRYKILW